MCAKEGGEVPVGEAFVREELREGCGGGVDVGKEACGCGDVAGFAPDPGLCARTAWAGHHGVVAGEDWGMFSLRIMDGDIGLLTD